jgi:Leucine-rich repeat (LRR) protein
LSFSRKLKRLNLGGNELQSVPTSALSSFDMLKKLEIQENLISEISEGDFEGMTCSPIQTDWKRNHDHT